MAELRKTGCALVEDPSAVLPFVGIAQNEEQEHENCWFRQPISKASLDSDPRKKKTTLYVQ